MTKKEKCVRLVLDGWTRAGSLWRHPDYPHTDFTLAAAWSRITRAS
jgi:hypothetical protein